MEPHENWRRLLLRTDETAQKYEAAQKNPVKPGCRLCNDTETIQDFTHWRLMPNAFPYDRFFSKCIMLVPKRHTNETGLNEEELLEFRELKQGNIMEGYDLIFENLPNQKSIPNHLHYHVVQIKRTA